MSIFHDNPNLDYPCGIDGGVIATLLDTAGWFAVAAQRGLVVVPCVYAVRIQYSCPT